MVTLVTLFFLFINASSGSVIKDGNLVLYRSQFRTNSIGVDGTLNEDDWSNAGSILIDFISGDTEVRVEIYLINDENYLYLGISVNEESRTSDSSASVFFDVDGDGMLNTPEDAKTIYFATIVQVMDSYFDGDEWIEDRSQEPSTDEFIGKMTRTSDFTYYEMRIQLAATDLPYDGLRIADPRNTFLAMSFQITTRINSTKETFNYPTIPNNGSGYLDTKLAGPEDQDLPEYIPPVVQTETSNPTYYPPPPVNSVMDTVANLTTVYDEAPGMTLPVLFLAVVSALVVRKRRHSK